MDYEELNPQGIDPEEARELSVRANGVRWWPTFKAAASDLLDTNLVSPAEKTDVESASIFEYWIGMIDDPDLAAGDGGGHYSTADLVEVEDVPEGVRTQTGWDTAVTKYRPDEHGKVAPPADELAETLDEMDDPPPESPEEDEDG
jgi:hypothetical protein